MTGSRLTLGLQLYTVRRPLAVDFEGTLAAVAAIGYEAVELAGLHGRTPAAFRAALEGVGLAAPSGHVQYDDLGEAWPRHLAAAEVGQAYVVCAAAPHAFRPADAVARLGEVLTRAGEAARGGGLRFAYHDHALEFEAADGAVAYDRLIEATDAAAVDFELDLHWAFVAGREPARYFERTPAASPSRTSGTWTRRGVRPGLGTE